MEYQDDSIARHLQRMNIRTWGRWIILSIVIFTIGCGVGLAILSMFDQVFFGPILAGIVGGFIIALISNILPDMAIPRRYQVWWLLLNILGMTIGLFILSTFAEYLLTLWGINNTNTSIFVMIILSALGGAVVGINQWLILRRTLSNAWWWVFAVSTSWMVLMLLLQILFPGD